MASDIKLYMRTQIQTKCDVIHNTLILYSNMLHGLLHQNQHQQLCYRNLKNVSTFGTREFFVNEISLTYLFSLSLSLSAIAPLVPLGLLLIHEGFVVPRAHTTTHHSR